MTVWILETDIYDNRGIVGVFTSADAAKQHWEKNHPDVDPGWEQGQDGRWDNKHDWSLAASVYEMEVE